MGATMWKAKQAGKDPKFWKKGDGVSEETAPLKTAPFLP